MSSDGYKQRREEEMRWVLNNNELLYGFFGRKAESIREVQQRLHAQLQAREINKMKSEIAELNATR
jgi:hypothetical protein